MNHGQEPGQPPRRSFWSVVHRRPGLLAAIVTVVVGAVAVTLAVALPSPAPVVVGAPGLAPILPESGELSGTPGGVEVRDTAAGVTYTLPVGWTELDSEGLLFNLSSAGARDGGESGGTFLGVGVMDGSLFASAESTVSDAAARLATDFGEFFLPVTGERTDVVDEASTVDGRPAWTTGYVVVPSSPSDEGGQIRVTVIDDGQRWLYALAVTSPADPVAIGEAGTAISSIQFD